MKRFAIAVMLLAGCAEKSEPARPLSQIRGAPINAVTQMVAVASAPTIATNPPAISTNVAVVVTNAPIVIDGYERVGFDRLASFHYLMPDEISPTNQAPADQFPKEIRSLDAKPVVLRGFMLPLKIEEGLVTEMLIMKDQSMCCYGTSPKITEWVSVKMAAKGVKPVMDQPVMLFGKLRVGEMRENGYLIGIYQLDGDKMSWQ